MQAIEYKTEFSLWAVASAPLIVAADVRNMSALQKEILLNHGTCANTRMTIYSTSASATETNICLLLLLPFRINCCESG
jgi:hypothetical protein